MSQDVVPQKAIPKDDRLTVIAVAALACILQNVLHEGVGHGLASYLLGAHTVTLSTVAENSDIASRWIDAAGTLVNLLAAAVFYLALRVLPVVPRSRSFWFSAWRAICLPGPATSCSQGSSGLATGSRSSVVSILHGCGGWAWCLSGLPATSPPCALSRRSSRSSPAGRRHGGSARSRGSLTLLPACLPSSQAFGTLPESSSSSRRRFRQPLARTLVSGICQAWCEKISAGTALAALSVAGDGSLRAQSSAPPSSWCLVAESPGTDKELDKKQKGRPRLRSRPEILLNAFATRASAPCR